jgi:hypothetical protein
MRVLLPALLLGACDPTHTNEPPVDARSVLVDSVAVRDTPFMCAPIAPRLAPGAACLALTPGAFQGDTPFGRLDVALDYFGAGDCITISSASIGWTGACGEQLRIAFPYPVDSLNNRRRVTQSFDTDARFEFTPPGMAMRVDTAKIHVEVAQWQEGDGTHDIDVTVNVIDSRYAVAPWRVVGTFCDWPYYLC